MMATQKELEFGPVGAGDKTVWGMKAQTMPVASYDDTMSVDERFAADAYASSVADGQAYRLGEAEGQLSFSL